MRARHIARGEFPLSGARPRAMPVGYSQVTGHQYRRERRTRTDASYRGRFPSEDTTMTDPVHAERREPSPPTGALDLAAAGRELLEQAGEMAAGRAARTLTPGAGSPLKQTLVALDETRDLDEHTSPGPATLHVLSGQVTLRTGDTTLQVPEDNWAVLPTAAHDLHADKPSVVLITVALPGRTD